jgi:acylglycerol lipase
LHRQYPRYALLIARAKGFWTSAFLAAFVSLQTAAFAAQPFQPSAAAAASASFGTPEGASFAWLVDNPKAVVIAVHGTTQQAGCFSSLSKHLNNAGFSLIGMDLRGHGHWYYSPDAAHEKRAVDYAKSAADLHELASSARSRYPNVPIFCIGESVGSTVATMAAGQHHDLFDGVILVSAGSRPGFYNPFRVTRDFLVGITDLRRPMDVSPYILKYSSEDPRITHEMVTDKLSRTTLTGKEILQTAFFIRKAPVLATKLSSTMPVLILQGQKDHIVTSSSVRTILRKLPSSNKELFVVPNCGHILLGTAFLKDSVVAHLTQWLEQQTGAMVPAVATIRNVRKNP